MTLGRMILIAALILATPVAAQDSVTRTDALLDRIVLEGRVLVTCLSLTDDNQARNVDLWASRAGRTLSVLESAGYDADKIARFRDAARIEALRPAPDALFSDVEAFCVSQPGVLSDIRRGTLIRLPRELEETLIP